MRRAALTRRLALSLGVVYLLLGVLETVRLTVTGDGGLLFWFGSLMGGGTLLLVGAGPREVPRDRRHTVAVLLGAVVGLPATAWTVAVPLLAGTVIVLTLSVRPRTPAQG